MDIITNYEKDARYHCIKRKMVRISAQNQVIKNGC